MATNLCCDPYPYDERLEKYHYTLLSYLDRTNHHKRAKDATVIISYLIVQYSFNSIGHVVLILFNLVGTRWGTPLSVFYHPYWDQHSRRNNHNEIQLWMNNNPRHKIIRLYSTKLR